METGSRAKSTREVSRWRRDEVYRPKTKKVHWSPDVKDNRRETPEPKSSARGIPKKRDSISSHSGGSYKSHRRSSLESPSKLQKINETSELRFTTAEELIERAFIDFPTSTRVGPTKGNSLSSSKCTQILGKSHSPESATSAKRASPLAPDSRLSSSSDQHQASWRESTENEDAPPGFSVIKSVVEGKIASDGAEDNPCRQASSDGQDGRESTMIFSGMSSESGPACALDHAQTGNTEQVFRKRRYQEKKFAGKEDLLSGMDKGQEDSGLDAALPENVGGSCETHESGGADAPMPEKSDGPDTSTELINNPAGIKFKVWSSSSGNDDQERNLQKNLPKSQEDPKNVPALKVIWMGNFDVRDKSNFIRYKGILAHPSAKVSRRAYDLSKQIPGAALLFGIHPRHEFWPARFQTSCPGRNDIALYFYPSKYEKSKRHYSTLLKLMEKDDLVLRARMGNVQLLVYSSKLLQADFQTLDDHYFMWGVFCGPKVAFKGSCLPSTSVA